MDKNELRRERARLLEQAKGLLDRAENERRGLTPAEERVWNELVGGANYLAGKIGGPLEQVTGVDSFRAAYEGLGRSQGTLIGGREPLDGQALGPAPGEIRTLGPGESLARVVPAVTASGVRADELSLGRLVRGIVTGDWRGADAERRALSEGTDTLGGYLVPTPLSARVIDLARNQAAVMAAGATTVPMEAHQLTLARVTGDPGVGWKAENASITASDMAFGSITLTAKTLAALVKLSVELVEDAPNVTQVVESAISQALALELDRAALRGNGTSEPLGVRNTSGVQVIDLGANGAPLTSYAKFSEAVQAIAERNGPTSGLAAIYAPRTAGTIDRLVDADGQPLQPPASFAGLRKLVTTQVPTNLTKGTATNASEAYVGDFRQVLVGARTNLVLEVSREAGDGGGGAFRDLQVWIRAYLRADVALARPEHFVVIDGITP